jgi:hypothetical protein
LVFGLLRISRKNRLLADDSRAKRSITDRALVLRSFQALSPVGWARGHAGDAWVVDLGV